MATSRYGFELANCPKCGSDKLIFLRNGGITSTESKVRCLKCEHWRDDWSPTLLDAVSDWNKR